jgi:adenine deaminase
VNRKSLVDASSFRSAIIRRRLVDVLMDPHLKATLVLKDGLLVNVITREIYRADVAVYGDTILMVGDASDLVGPATEVVDLKGASYIAPGFIDAHMHFESAMLTLSEFSRLSLPTGTTTLIADPHEIGNALGPAGIRAMSEEAGLVRNRVFLAVPALTPDCPGLETAGYDIGSKDMEELLGYPRVIGVGELQGFSNARFVYEHSPEVVSDLIASTTYARSLGKTVDGNAPELFGSELAAHIIAGGTDVSCHETTRKEECLEKLRYGVYVFMREGSTQKNLAECLRVVKEEGLDSRRLIGATDDMMAEDLLQKGHMNWVVRRMIEEGIDPVEAIQMVTINPATYFGLDEIGVLAPGKRADLVVLSDLAGMKVERVYVGGRKVAEKGGLSVSIPGYRYPENVKRSFATVEVGPGELSINAEGDRVTARTIGLIPDQNLTEALESTLRVVAGRPQPDLERDVLPIAVVERYGRNGSIGRAFVTGFGLKRGAFAESVSHDCHNVIVVGVSYEEMALAVNRVFKMNGGVAVVRGEKTLGELALPIGGLMTDELDGFALTAKLNDLHRLLKDELGCGVHAPLMHLSFLSLSTSPTWKITDQGLLDVNQLRILPVVKEGT